MTAEDKTGLCHGNVQLVVIVTFTVVVVVGGALVVVVVLDNFWPFLDLEQ